MHHWGYFFQQLWHYDEARAATRTVQPGATGAGRQAPRQPLPSAGQRRVPRPNPYR